MTRLAVRVVPRFARTPLGAIGVTLLLVILGLALLGPLFAPHAIDLSIGAPGEPPRSGALLGTDFLGRDILSRTLHGGLTVLGLSSAATALAYLIGATIGLGAGYSRTILDPILMRAVDVILAFPAIVVLLLLVGGLGTSVPVLLVGVALVLLPSIARLVRTATLEIASRGYVEAAVARGEKTWSILVHEITPNIASVLLADMGLKFGYSIIGMASMNYLGLGLNPPTADWGLMISENRQFVSLNPWSVLAPAILLASLTIAINLVGDAYARTLGKSPGKHEGSGRWIAHRRQQGDAVTTAPQPSAGLEVKGLRVETADGEAIVGDVSLTLAPGEILGIVGESGSGKTTMALALLAYTQSGARIAAGEVVIAGVPVRMGGQRPAREIRGRLISYVPQNPGTALNPSMSVGDAIREMVRTHAVGSETRSSVTTALEHVGLPGSKEFQHRYPHQVSGGQQQRVCIASALVCQPPVVVLDEPTTGLDVVTQARILEQLLRLRSEDDLSMVYVTHDLAVVAQVADRIAVMYAGRIVEEGPARDVLQRPRHPYTRGLLASIPDHLEPRKLEPMPGVAVGVGERPSGCAFAPRCPLRVDACDREVPPFREIGPRHRARCLRVDAVTRLPVAPIERPRGQATEKSTILTVTNLRAEHRSGRETIVAAHDVSFILARGQCVALVGESGSGKTTIARVIAGLHPIAAGEVKLGRVTLASLARRRTAEQRRRIQIMFQNPSDALNPRHIVRRTISRPARILRGLSAQAADLEVDRLLELVRMPKRLADRYPAELSGGERQRVAIARALAVEPEVVICDEITSALDVSVQAAVLKLLDELRAQLGLALLFITHDLGVVATIADEALVLDQGRVCESGPIGAVLGSPVHEYTQRLLASAPSVSHALDEWRKWESEHPAQPP